MGNGKVNHGAPMASDERVAYRAALCPVDTSRDLLAARAEWRRQHRHIAVHAVGSKWRVTAQWRASTGRPLLGARA